MAVELEAEAITTEVIVNCTNWLETDMSEDILIIDCRPFMVYNAGHINSAQNAHCPPIIKRRSGGMLSLEHIIRCPHTRAKLITGEFRAIVVYDENTRHLSDLSENDNMKLVLKSLQEDAGMQNVYYLVGGYTYFEKQFPHLCDVHLFSMLPPAMTSFVELTQLDPTDPSLISLPAHPHHRTQLTCDTVKYHPSDDQGEPVEMLPWLFLGNAFHATQETSLRNLNISALLNVCSSLDRPPNNSPFVYKKIPIDDNSTADVMQWFPDAIQYIERVREGQGKVLVHCEAGISRSATICIAYLMCYKRWTLEFAYDFVKSRRNLIAPNLNFMQQLHQFETQLFGPSVEPPLSCVSVEEFHLPLTPCSTQACVFQFDSPHTGSPTAPYASPLISPS